MGLTPVNGEWKAIKASPRRTLRPPRKKKSFTAEDAKVAKEEQSFTAKDAKDAKEEKSFTAEDVEVAEVAKYYQ